MRFLLWLLCISVLGLSGPVHAQAQDRIASNVYAWTNASVEATDNGSKRILVRGAATDFNFMDITATTLRPLRGEPEMAHAAFEEMIIIKEGKLNITLSGGSNTLGRGSVAVVMPGDKRSLTNATEGETTFYSLRYQSRRPLDAARGDQSGKSFVMDWNDVKVTPRDDGKGETRNFFAKPTTMGRRLELHSTLLSPSQNSHAPHRHRAEEMVILLDAEVEMYLGPGEHDGKVSKATSGDIIYLVSNEYHAISNIGVKPALYFAFQFE